MKFLFSVYPFKKLNSGGFSFLNLLTNVFSKNNNYINNWEQADLILLNSHHWINSVFKIILLKIKGREFVLRIDGPLNIYRKTYHSFFEDLLIHSFAINLSSGIIFQSKWSAEQNFKCNPKLKEIPYTIIYNGGTIFSDKNKNFIREEACLFVSNSSNFYKGFKLYQEFAERSIFVKELKDLKFYVAGNINSPFKNLVNIKSFGPINKEKLLNLMVKTKYYIHPSKYEACSNALIESINFGMIPLIYNGSSNIEIVKDHRLRFKTVDKLIENLINVRKEECYSDYSFLKLDINKTADYYLKFFYQVLKKNNKKYKIIKIIKFLFVFSLYYFSLYLLKLRSIIRRLF